MEDTYKKNIELNTRCKKDDHENDTRTHKRHEIISSSLSLCARMRVHTLMVHLQTGSPKIGIWKLSLVWHTVHQWWIE